MDLRIEGKRALVCGASQGMGLALAKALAAEGVRVFMCARSEDTLRKSEKEVAAVAEASAGTRAASAVKAMQCMAQACDLSNPSDRDRLCKSILDKWGGLDIIVHNTGGPSPSTAEETKLTEWQKGFDQLFLSVVALNEAFIPGMKQQRWGRILNVTSLSVLEPISNLAVSNAIRSAATAYLKTLADELAPFNITVNCVAPGSISTGRVEELIEARAKKNKVSYEEYEKEYMRAIPMGRLGTPEEFASVVAFLASEQASYVTGSTICVDGGKRRSTY